jgi:hypothetical protein
LWLTTCNNETNVINRNNKPMQIAFNHNHRNLRARRRMHLCMQDDQIGWKFMGFAPADMATLPHWINIKNSF